MRSLSALSPAAGLCPVKFDGLELVELDPPTFFQSHHFLDLKKCSAILKENHGYICPRFAGLREIQG